ncbi:MAG: Zn-ribbon domain-containing OB-fold protein [Chloroflexi bacterium]|nr:Zn-ribbon domain-containing OB-fold protein [Chloroflexota bacterium]
MRNEVGELPGVPLTEKDVLHKKVLSTEWDPKLKWAWDTGIGYGRYLNELKKGRIVGSKCNKCKRVLLPARAFCELCFRQVDEWVHLKDTGTVNTFSIAYTDWVARRIKEPRIPAMIEIDGSGGVAILHLLGAVDPKQVRVGLRVKAVWKPESQREGAITDILHWLPMGEG